MGRSETSINMSRRTTEFNSRCVPDDAIEKMKFLEAPQFKQGKLIMQEPLRHCIPRCKFYYNSDEWFNATDVPKDRETSSLVDQMNESQRTHDKVREQKLSKRKRSCSTSETSETVTTTLPPKALEDEDSEEYKQTFNIEVPSKVYADTYIRRGVSKWATTPIPGIRICKEYDQYRVENLRRYSKIYNQDRSVLPKYGGYVPGLKFRYGSPFGQLTLNARELGIEANKSRTWGGAVSLF